MINEIISVTGSEYVSAIRACFRRASCTVGVQSGGQLFQQYMIDRGPCATGAGSVFWDILTTCVPFLSDEKNARVIVV